MLNNINLFKYVNIDSPLHRMNSLIKILCLLLYITTLIFCNTLLSVSAMAVLLILMVILSKINLKIYLKNILSLKYIFILVIIATLLFGTNILESFITIIKLILIVINSIMLTLTTSSKEITDGITLFLYPLKIFKIPTYKVSLSVSLSIQFIPMIIKESNKILKSMASRGLDFYNSTIKNKIISLKAIVIPMFVLTLKRSDDIADIMDIRTYDFNQPISNKIKKLNYYDVFILIIYLLIMIAFIIKEV